jgi:hypothetical protein
VVEAANRGNVSFYTVDAAGLRVHSEQAATARAVASSGFAGTGDTPPDEAAAETGGGALTKRLEKNEFTLRQDPHASLGLLARATGGFLIENTNDLAGAFGRIDADRRFHYLLTYTSANAVQDGSYRRLTVKVRRKNVDVRARSGYYAVPALGTLPTLHFETAALAALAERPRRTEIPIRASALAFPTPARPGQLAIVVAVPGTGLTYYMDREKTSYWSDFTILTQIVDAEGRVVRKGSQPYHLTGPADRLDVARRGDVLLYRQPVLPPGRYTLDYVISDALGAKAGTGSMPLVVDAVGPGEPAVSGLVIVSRAERVTEAERDPINPLYVGDLLLYPNLGDPLSRSADRRLTFYYAVHAGTQPVTASLELATGEVVLARLPLSLPPPDAAGRIQHLAQFPLGDVPPGSCELRVTVTAGSARVTRVAAFTLEP